MECLIKLYGFFMESKIAEVKAKIKLIKSDLLGLMPNEIQSFGKKAVVQTLNRTWDYFPSKVEEVAEKIFFRPKHSTVWRFCVGDVCNGTQTN